ncbi:unnamed protein product [Trypanosoma congolense IL3000]|uniref:WGS project CAEQ00000000 data, annotated contig 2154 n=1 Tax=Trypanosoma congolense (strain IL3000) TaxID=1068625 RepID=F9WBW3_TRYCI|nr:unnamed protein product [Trypanosoma congolense IL3000]
MQSHGGVRFPLRVCVVFLDGLHNYHRCSVSWFYFSCRSYVAFTDLPLCACTFAITISDFASGFVCLFVLFFFFTSSAPLCFCRYMFCFVFPFHSTLLCSSSPPCDILVIITFAFISFYFTAIFPFSPRSNVSRRPLTHMCFVCAALLLRSMLLVLPLLAFIGPQENH